MSFYRHKLYELIEDNDFEMVFEETTMEDCSNIAYNGDEVKEQFDDQTGNFDRVGWSHKVLKTNRLITYVLKQLETKKEVYVSLNEYIMDQLAGSFNVQFKEHGFMYRPSKQCFVKYKTPKPKVLKFAPKAMQNAIRLGLC